MVLLWLVVQWRHLRGFILGQVVLFIAPSMIYSNNVTLVYPPFNKLALVDEVTLDIK